MRISVSNIAWDPAEDDEVSVLLHKYGIDAIDVAPPKYFPDPKLATDQDIQIVRRTWQERGFEIVGMQSLMFGTTGLNVFASTEIQDAMLAHLAQIARIGAGLGASRLVFGSPRNRDRGLLSDSEVAEVATSFFWRLGDVGKCEGVVFCLEPNPAAYQCNFLTETVETCSFVAELNHPSIKLQLDLGAIRMNAEDPSAVIRLVRDQVGHIHVSEPNLTPVGDMDTDHDALGALLHAEGLGNSLATIEMVASKFEDHVVSIERACRETVKAYRNTC